MSRFINQKIAIILGIIYLLNQIIGLAVAWTFDLRASLTSSETYSLYFNIKTIINNLYFFFGLVAIGSDVFNNFSEKYLKHYRLGLICLSFFTLPYVVFAVYHFTIPKGLVVNSVSLGREYQFAQYRAFFALWRESDVTNSERVGDFVIFRSEVIDNQMLKVKLNASDNQLGSAKAKFKIQKDLVIPLVITNDNRYFKYSSKSGSCFGGVILITEQVFESEHFKTVLLHEYIHYLNHLIMQNKQFEIPIFIDELISYALEDMDNPKHSCESEYMDRTFLKDVYSKLNNDEKIYELLISPNKIPLDRTKSSKYLFFKIFGCNLIKDFSLQSVLRWAEKSSSMDMKKAFKKTFGQEMVDYIEGSHVK